jgi:D-alanyl-D-alanine carboxypeptidase (penicillin-binding protein 5/6)
MILLITSPVFAATQPNITGEYAILMDQKSGQILYDKSADATWYPASTTKVLTALIILENHTLDEVVTVDGESPFVDGSKIFIFEDEQLTVEQLINAMLIASANDCAEALAVFHSGSIENFSLEMNQRAYALGAVNSNFVNPHGLHSDEHYSTARDMALIAQAAYSLPAFQEIVAKRTYSIDPTEYQAETRYMSSTNHFINGSKRMLYNGVYVQERYDIVDGIKTGYTTKSKNNLISTAQKNGSRLISVVLKSSSQSIYIDSRSLLDYGFDNYKYHNFTFSGNKVTQMNIENGNIDSIDIFAQDSISGMVPADFTLDDIEEKLVLDPIELPVEPEKPLGTLEYYVEGDLIGSTVLITDQHVVEQTMGMTVKSYLVREDGLGNLNYRYYLNIVINLLISFLIWRTLITMIRIINRRRKRKKASKDLL